MKVLLAIALAGFAALACAGAQAATYEGTYSAANEVPPTGTLATGSITVTVTGDTLTVVLSFSDLASPASAAHIHCCAPVGVNAAVALPFNSFPNTTSGSYTNSFDLTLSSTYNAAFITASGGTVASAEAALLAGLDAGEAYANIHDANYPGGEIRANLLSSSVPEAATWLMMVAAFGAVGFAMRRRASAV